MSLGPYASFILTSYLMAVAVVLALIGWIVMDHRQQTRRLRDMERSGIARRSGRGATDIA